MNDLPAAGGFGARQLTVLRRIAACGTGLLGWMHQACTDCGVVRSSGLGCQDRHCPGCGLGRTQDWTDAREAELIDCDYFHFVFTIAGLLYPLFLENQRELYSLVMRCVNETLKKFAADDKFLGGTMSAFSILHTTNRRLDFHPHVHVVIAGAGLDEANGKLVTPRKADFLFPVRALAAVFRWKVLDGIRDLADAGKLTFNGPNVRHLANRRNRERLLQKLRKVNWWVHTKPAFGGPSQVVRYLARYTHRTAISNRRIVGMDDGRVTYSWDDRKTGKRNFNTMPVMDFVRKFARHILPKGFKRVRLFGLLSPRKRKTALPLAQRLAQKRAGRLRLNDAIQAVLQPERRATCCPDCKAGNLVTIAITGKARPPIRFPAVMPTAPPVPPGAAPLETG